MVEQERCRGRLTGKSKKPDGEFTLEFIKDRPDKKRGNIFFVPVRCAAAAAAGSALCATCLTKKATTEAKECVKNGTYVANQETLFHGLVGEMPPLWSHVYKSVWFNEFSKSPKHRVSAEVFAIAEAGLAACPGGPEAVLGCDACVAKPALEPALEAVVEKPAKEVTRKPFMAKKKVTIVEQPTAVVEIPVAAPEPAVKPKKRAAPKKVVAATPAVSQPPIGIIEKKPLSDLPVVQVKVRKVTIDERAVYLGEKDKVYDLKFKYLGRYNRREDRIEAKYPDSDQE
jgi:hypothetical protein